MFYNHVVYTSALIRKEVMSEIEYNEIYKIWKDTKLQNLAFTKDIKKYIYLIC